MNQNHNTVHIFYWWHILRSYSSWCCLSCHIKTMKYCKLDLLQTQIVKKSSTNFISTHQILKQKKITGLFKAYDINIEYTVERYSLFANPRIFKDFMYYCCTNSAGFFSSVPSYLPSVWIGSSFSFSAFTTVWFSEISFINSRVVYYNVAVRSVFLPLITREGTS